MLFKNLTSLTLICPCFHANSTKNPFYNTFPKETQLTKTHSNVCSVVVNASV